MTLAQLSAQLFNSQSDIGYPISEHRKLKKNTS